MLGALPTPLLVAVLLAAAATVAVAGTRLSRLAAALTERTRLGAPFVGILFLGGATSLPELATTVTATATRAPDLAVGNLLGGVAAQLAILAAADLASSGALPLVPPRRALLGQCALLAVHLAIVVGGLLLPGPTILGLGAWSFALLAAYPLLLLAARRLADADEPSPSGVEGRLGARAALAAGAILAGGVALVLCVEELAERSGVGASLAGATLVAWTTSLPELSSTWGAMRLGRADLAVANIVGANLLQVTLLAGVDAGTPGAPVLAEAQGGLAFALLAAGLTGLLALGALWRRQPTAGRLALTSWAMLTAYFGTLAAIVVA